MYKEDTDIVIKCEKRYILVFEYIEKSFDGFRYDLDEYWNVQKEIVTALVYIVEIILNHKRNGYNKYFYIKWKDYKDEENI